MASIYMVALHTSLLAMFGGVGSVAPNNFVEYAFLTFILLTGCFFWAYVISTLCSLLATLDPHKTQANRTVANPNPNPSYFLLPTSYFVLRTSYFLLPTSYFLLTTHYLLLTTYA
tara:strand:- start:132 stop:476 length:345 start_codon:yes stop_codon:yes gene_type:complete